MKYLIRSKNNIPFFLRSDVFGEGDKDGELKLKTTESSPLFFTLVALQTTKEKWRIVLESLIDEPGPNLNN